ncbi:hypothetical protein IWX46DRAFT_327686 [Phyllosticta citricarpa]|uniref:BRCT domain-containing protein n=1 Tax=Phyllosticta citricarpa TaxID=55181 RepID=A0ABR1LE60_9PEZI
MKNPLKRLIITASGTFSKDRGPGNMKRWVENAGGRWSTVVNDEVTHLIATEDDWKNQSPTVKDAKTRAKIHIVTYDWLEDSLRAQHPYAPKKYLWTTVEKVKQAAKSTTGKKREKKEESEEGKFTSLHLGFGLALLLTHNSEGLEEGCGSSQAEPPIRYV